MSVEITGRISPVERPDHTGGGPTRKAGRTPLINRRGFRIGVGIGVLALAALVMAPRLVSYRASDAIVQANTAMLTTPIEGVVREVRVRPGETVSAGQLVARIENPRIDKSYLGELTTERNYLTARIASLEEQANGLEDLRADLRARKARVEGGAASVLTKEIVEAEAQANAIAAELRAVEADYRRQASLAERGHVSQAALEEAEAERGILTARLDAQRARVERLGEERRQASEGVFMADGRFGSSQAEIRLDELRIQLLDIAARKAQDIERIAQIERQIAEERARIERVQDYELTAPADGIVWKVLAPAGTETVIGAEVVQMVDCGSAFVEMLVSESRFDAINPGDTFRYRLTGTDKFRTGKVATLKGGNVSTEDRTLAAALDAQRDRDFRIWGELASEDRNAAGAAFCNVGRHVDARFAQDWDPLSWLRSIWSAL